MAPWPVAEGHGRTALWLRLYGFSAHQFDEKFDEKPSLLNFGLLFVPGEEGHINAVARSWAVAAAHSAISHQYRHELVMRVYQSET